MKEFELTLEQTRIMFSYQYHLVLVDINDEPNYEKKNLKKLWLSEWKDSAELLLKSEIDEENTLKKPSQKLLMSLYQLFERYLAKLPEKHLWRQIVQKICQVSSYYSSFSQAHSHFKPSETPIESSFHLIIEFSLLLEFVKKIKMEDEEFRLYLILIEVVLFTPYYSLGTVNDEKYKDLKIADKTRLLAKQKYLSSTIRKEEDCEKIISEYKKAVSNISGKKDFIKPLAVGLGLGGAILGAALAPFSVPFLAGLLTPYYGAAAVSVFLAGLGGGAIVSGGLGMVGGMAVVVGGGAVLGGVGGVGGVKLVGSLFAESPDIALSQAARLVIAVDELIFTCKNIQLAQEIIKNQRITIRSLEDELDKLYFDRERNTGKIDSLTKSIVYLKKALEINQNLLVLVNCKIDDYTFSP